MLNNLYFYIINLINYLIISPMRHLFLPFHIWEEKQMTQNASAFSPAFFNAISNSCSQRNCSGHVPCG